ncbi:hypothetical protein T439DRAFT_324665 [Meredithblackwellia eburnea MCA 4105]
MAANKLTNSLKTLLKAPHARGGPLPAPTPARTKHLFDLISSSAKSNGLAHDTWLTLSTAALVTLNSPATLCELYSYSTKDLPESDAVERAAIMREVGLKCISFSGIPRTINSLGALRTHLPESVASQLNTKQTRLPTPETTDSITGPRAHGLWNSIYAPHHEKLLQKLALSHPDLPVHILASHYGALLSDPPLPSPFPSGHYKIGRVLTSVVAISCLRAQQGVTPQVTSHVYGLKKALEEGSEGKGVQGEKWLTTDEGCEWVLNSVDEIVAEVTGGKGSFAAGSQVRESKL